MSRIFFRAFFTAFLWFILLVNLLFAFNMTNLVGGYGVIPVGDTTNKYFGFTSMLHLFENMDESPLGRWMSYSGEACSGLFNLSYEFFAGTKLPNPNDLNISWDFFKQVLEVLSRIVQYMVGIFVYISALFSLINYGFATAFCVLFTLLQGMGGAYAKDLPESRILDSVNYICLYPPFNTAYALLGV